MEIYDNIYTKIPKKIKCINPLVEKKSPEIMHYV